MNQIGNRTSSTKWMAAVAFAMALASSACAAAGGSGSGAVGPVTGVAPINNGRPETASAVPAQAPAFSTPKAREKDSDRSAARPAGPAGEKRSQHGAISY